MKKTYYNPNLTILAIQSLGVICGVSGENSPQEDPTPDGTPNAAARKIV